jgi:hypothetical protein
MQLGADHIHLSVRMIQVENRWTDFDKIWVELEVILNSFFLICYIRFSNMADEQTCEVRATIAPYNRPMR